MQFTKRGEGNSNGQRMLAEYEKASTNNTRRVTMVPSLRTDLIANKNAQHKTVIDNPDH